MRLRDLVQEQDEREEQQAQARGGRISRTHVPVEEGGAQPRGATSPWPLHAGSRTSPVARRPVARAATTGDAREVTAIPHDTAGRARGAPVAHAPAVVPRSPGRHAFVLPWVRLHALEGLPGAWSRLLAETPRRARHLQPGALAARPGRGLRQRTRLTERRAARGPAAGGASSTNLRARLPPCARCFLVHPRTSIGALSRACASCGSPCAAPSPTRTPRCAWRAAAFGAQDLRDLQVLSKLAWFDLDWLA